MSPEATRALEEARGLCGEDLYMHSNGPCLDCRAIAAALLRREADGAQHYWVGRGHSACSRDLRLLADKIERGEVP